MHGISGIIDYKSKTNLKKFLPQPVMSKDNRYKMAYDGVINNCSVIRKELKKLGYEFHSNEDAEVVINSYAQK
jgi:asparagine synthetase B (glutamine-hydrolysing)